jgi:hypothetical protein
MPESNDPLALIDGFLSHIFSGFSSGGSAPLGGTQSMAPEMTPASFQWGTQGTPSILGTGAPQAPQLISAGAPGGGIMGGGTASYNPTAPIDRTQMPQAPNPYMAAIAEARPAIMEAMRLRAIRPPTYLSRTYNIPAAQPVTAGQTVQQPARRLSPLERYQMMLSGMRG